MTPRLSIVVPAYNAADTLGRCLDSLLAQEENEIEILVVDDGSTDGTLALAEAYAAKDARVRVFGFAHNRGVSEARNHALDQARGAYIGFCDADDWVATGMYAALLRAAETNGAEVTFCAVIKELPDGPAEVPLPWPDGTVLDAAAIRNDLVPRMVALDFDGEALPLSGYTPRNLFARQVLEDVRFRADIRYAEDLLFIVEALLRAQRVAVVAAPLYHYRFHGGSTTQRYSPFVPASQYASQDALAALFAGQGLADALALRMAIRARRNVQTAVINLCLPGTPFGGFRRVGAIRGLLRSTEARAAFRGVPLGMLARREPKQALKYGLIRLRWAMPLMVLYSYVYKSR
ncbi:MAG: glycosyltransferase family 2 protein [Clostridia bacterium]|nr:glycosyltransferase family 2 protein [Clostridia bacterium]